MTSVAELATTSQSRAPTVTATCVEKSKEKCAAAHPIPDPHPHPHIRPKQVRGEVGGGSTAAAVRSRAQGLCALWGVARARWWCRAGRDDDEVRQGAERRTMVC